jgi:hypothetical protein
VRTTLPIRGRAARSAHFAGWSPSIGENVGSEINGKSQLFSRPVIIVKKLAHGFYFVIPTTTKSKVGSWFIPFRQADRNMVASLH